MLRSSVHLEGLYNLLNLVVPFSSNLQLLRPSDLAADNATPVLSTRITPTRTRRLQLLNLDYSFSTSLSRSKHYPYSMARGLPYLRLAGVFARLILLYIIFYPWVGFLQWYTPAPSAIFSMFNCGTSCQQARKDITGIIVAFLSQHELGSSIVTFCKYMIRATNLLYYALCSTMSEDKANALILVLITGAYNLILRIIFIPVTVLHLLTAPARMILNF